MQGTIGTENEFRWYAFVLNEKSKSTIMLQFGNDIDIDLYLYQLNGTQLELIGGSATEGAGVWEYSSEVLEPGTYFFAVSGYSGIGNYIFAYYQSSLDSSNELNDSVGTATGAGISSDIVGVIDHPNDRDYYSVNVSEPMVLENTITSSNNYKLGYAESSNGSTPKNISGNMWYMPKGIHYYAVESTDGAYLANSTYTVCFKNVASLADVNMAPIFVISEETGIIFQKNEAKSVYYVNGKAIDINYHLDEGATNSYGSQSYDIGLRDGSDVYAEEPKVIYYRNSSRPNINVPSKPALALIFRGPKGFYYVHCRCTGAYAENNYFEDFDAVRVIIDPDTGKMIDIDHFNYFYDFAVGSNSLSYTTPYKDMVAYEFK